MKQMTTMWAAMACATALQAAVPQIAEQSVQVTQNSASRIVTITYDLEGAPGIVTFDVLTNGASIGSVYLTNATGHVNRRIEPDTQRTIVWRPYETLEGRTFADGTVSVKVTAWATNAPPPYLVVDLANPAPANMRFYPDADAVPDGVTNDTYKTSKLVMRRIPAAGIIWRMGDVPCEENLPAKNVSRLVVLTNDYYLGIYPVTQAQWAKIYGYGADGASQWPSKYGESDRDTHPVENISWEDIRGNGDNTGVYNWPRNGHAINNSYVLGTLRQNTSLLFDLPTEAQWEFACRAGTTGTNNVDGVSLDETAWHSGLTDTSKPVGLKRPNAFGLYDMLGNVEELCLDRAGGNAANADGTPVVEPVGADATSGNRIRKGGGFICNTDKSLYWCRPGITGYGWSQKAENKCMGFRLWCAAGVP